MGEARASGTCPGPLSHPGDIVLMHPGSGLAPTTSLGQTTCYLELYGSCLEPLFLLGGQEEKETSRGPGLTFLQRSKACCCQALTHRLR